MRPCTVDDPIRILNLGGGVQSTTLFLRSLTQHEGLPKIDLAIFADTQWEPKDVYKTLTKLKEIGAAYGVPVVVVTEGSLRESLKRQAFGGEQGRFVSVPLHVIKDGKRSMVRRQCTGEYKIKPIEKYIRRHVLNLEPRKWAPREAVVEQWFGISADEIQRSRISPHKWSRFEYPLLGPPIGSFGSSWTRDMCKEYLQEEWPHLSVAKSACIGCPYHSPSEWLRIYQDPEAWQDAIEMDEHIRSCQKLDGTAYLHSSCRPLKELTEKDFIGKSKTDVSFQEECEGMCGV